MTLEEAKALLSTCKRSELRDHAFGDCEVYWEKAGHTAENGNEVAYGYFGADGAQVTIGDAHFTHGAARDLRNCGSLGTVERNDSTGPAEYTEGVTMPALTREGVLAELTTAPCRRCTECEGQDHHFSESGIEAREDASLFYVCKHCPARAEACASCSEPIWPAWSSPHCHDCNSEHFDEDNIAAREPW